MEDNPMDKHQKKQLRRYIAWGCAGALVVLLAVMPMLAAAGDDDTPQASILSGQAARQTLNSQIIGGGLLAGEAAVSLDIPENVKITEYLVGNGDTVAEGDPVALVDRVSVMTAIAQVQETLDYLSQQITSARWDTAPETVSALAAGTVKCLYAQEGDLVSEVMLKYGALAVLSLDGKMAVQVSAETQLRAGDAVTVTFSDGTQTPYAYTITDLQNLPRISVNSADLTVEKTYSAAEADISELTAGETVLLILDQDGSLVAVTKEPLTQDGQQAGPGGMGGMGSAGMSSGMSGGSMGGSISQSPAFEVYSPGHVSIGSVTSQEHMTVEITVDEQDISRLSPGQEAVITVDALGGESFDATVTRIANSGENSGGSSKFAVELTLEKSGEMLPGMTASAFLTVDTQADALCVPAAALERLGSQDVVYTGYDADSQTLLNPVAVTIGASDGDMVQILEGLEEGSKFYYAYYEVSQTGGSAQVPELPVQP